MLVFRTILRTYKMDDPYGRFSWDFFVSFQLTVYIRYMQDSSALGSLKISLRYERCMCYLSWTY